MRSDDAPLFNVPAPVVLIALALLLVHAFRGFLTQPEDLELLYRFAFIPARYGPDAYFPGGASAQVWTMVTYAFLHGNATHLVVNIVWLVCFGTALARRFGILRLAAVFLLGSIGGAAVHYVAMPKDAALLIGASAGVSAIMAATIRFVFAPNGPLAAGWKQPEAYHVKAPGMMEVLANRRVFAFILIWFVVNLAFGLQELLMAGASNLIAWQSHIGGFLAGFLIFPMLDRKRESVE